MDLFSSFPDVRLHIVDAPTELGFTRVRQYHCPSRQQPTWMRRPGIHTPGVSLKCIDGLCSMFVTAPHDVLRHAEIGRSVLPARKEIDVACHLEYRGYGFRARSLSAKLTQKAPILSR